MLGLGLGTAPAAGAVGTGVNLSNVVSAVPNMKLPQVTNGAVFAITQVGNVVILGGSFTAAQNHGSSTSLTRNYILAFDVTTGQISTTFVPALDNQVEALAPGPTSGTVYVAGNFNFVNGVRSKGITLLDTTTGAIVPGFKPPALNGIVYTIAPTSNRLYIAGSFTTVGGVTHGGIASLNPSTGALDPYMNVQFAGHHNYNGTGAYGAVGPRAMSINPAGNRLAVVGNFKTADGVVHDQIAILDLDATASVDPWNTAAYSAPCIRNAFDTYVTDVQYSADGSYFVITATGGSGGTNTDGSTPLCDSAARWESNSTGSNVQPTWVDYTGRDSLWSVAVTGSAVYVGGHERWLNNSNGSDRAGPGAVPRPAVAALDPASGVPMTWNPGRNPRGGGTYALYASTSSPAGLYIGGDQSYVGNRKYNTGKMAFFPLQNGYAGASTATASLPANVYLAGPLPSSDDLDYRPVSAVPVTPGAVGPMATVSNTGVAWSTTRGAFMAGNSIFYGQNGSFYRVSFDGTAVGAPELLDAYDDPYWSSVQTGSGQTYQGVKPTYLTSELPSVTGAFYAQGRMYYTLAGKSTLYSRLFSPDSGIIGSQEFSTSTNLPTNIAGMMLSGSTLYYADTSTGALHARTFTPATTRAANGSVGTTDTVVDNTHDWRARSLFPFGPPTAPDNPPTAQITSANCVGLTCSFTGSGSDPDGDPLTYAWSFGDGSPNASGAVAQHIYPSSGTYTVTLSVSDGRGGTGTATTTVSPQGTTAQIAFDGQQSFNSPTTNVQNPSVNVPGQPGDTVLLFASVNAVGTTNTTPAGWTQVSQFSNGNLQTTVYQHQAAAGDPSTVIVHLDAGARVDLQAVAYTGVGSVNVTNAGDSSTNTHVTPTAPVLAPSSWAVSYWADRTSAGQETWSLPGAVVQRGLDAPASGGGRVDSAIADSNGGVPVGSYGGQTATVTTADGTVAGKGDTSTVILAPAIT